MTEPAGDPIEVREGCCEAELVDMAGSDCNMTAEMPEYLMGFEIAVEKWVDGT